LQSARLEVGPARRVGEGMSDGFLGALVALQSLQDQGRWGFSTCLLVPERIGQCRLALISVSVVQRHHIL
jgi:hypothetical protein